MSDNEIIQLLKSITCDMENDNISAEKKQRIVDFLVQEKFIDGINDFSQDDIMKFVFLGWYIYNFSKK